jgi:predicted nucleotidyltransferase component of viral defense system
MKDRVLQLVGQAPQGQKRNVLREYVQAHVLLSLQSERAFERLAFVGGTALRFLYGLRRYSEDLDFTLEQRAGYRFSRLLERIESDLVKAGFDVTMHPREIEPIHSAFIRLPGLPYEAGLSPHRTEKASIKIEIDTTPPQGATLETTVINRHFLVALLHHDLPSLMAGKLHALLTRPYTKGRDLYDLLWYLSRPEPITPNLVLLKNALAQTEWRGPKVTLESWRAVVEDKLRELDFREVAQDVGPFLERPEERALLTQETLLAALEKGHGGASHGS